MKLHSEEQVTRDKVLFTIARSHYQKQEIKLTKAASWASLLPVLVAICSERCETDAAGDGFGAVTEIYNSCQ